MDEVEMRMGKRHSYEPAGSDGAPVETASENVLVPAYEVLINRTDIDEEAQKRFWVKDGRLHVGERAEELKPFDDADFALYRLQPLARRDDYTTFDFETVYWTKVQNHIWEDREEEARKAFRLLAVNLVECPDIVRPHRNLLLRMYKDRLDGELGQAKEIFDAGGPLGFDEANGPASLRESDVEKALDVGDGSRLALEPEQILAEVGV